MKILSQRTLSPGAADLLQFDADSIRLVVSAQHCENPDVWLADPDAYEKDGRVLRDSNSPRLLAYSTKDHFLYATDGCNSCARKAPAMLDQLEPDQLKQFAADNELRPELLEKLTELVRGR
jgi:hypothetical protein